MDLHYFLFHGARRQRIDTVYQFNRHHQTLLLSKWETWINFLLQFSIKRLILPTNDNLSPFFFLISFHFKRIFYPLLDTDSDWLHLIQLFWIDCRRRACEFILTIKMEYQIRANGMKWKSIRFIQIHLTTSTNKFPRLGRCVRGVRTAAKPGRGCRAGPIPTEASRNTGDCWFSTI